MAKKRKQPRKRQKTRSRKHLAVSAGLVVVLLVYIFVLRPSGDPSTGLADVFGLLEEQGFTPNVGFSDLYVPGNVIQIRKASTDGTISALPSPLPFLWAEDCFPDLDPRESVFVLPETSATSGSSLRLGAEAIAQIVPALAFDDAAVASYSLELASTRIHTVTSPEISRSFSRPCVDALRQAKADNHPLELYEVIVQAVVADALRFEIEWSSEASAEARAALGKRAGKALPSGDLAVKADDAGKTVLAADSRVVLGYRTLAIEEPPELIAEEPEVTVAETRAELTGQLTIERRDDSGQWQDVGVGHRFQTGDFFRFAVTSSHHGRLYVFHQAAAGKPRLLWPTAAEDGRSNLIETAKVRRVPPGPEAFRFDGDVGRESFYVAITATKQALDVPSAVRVENFIVGPRNVVVAPLPEDEQPLVFAAPAESDGATAAVRFQLRHAATP